jgi:hypothetical protein
LQCGLDVVRTSALSVAAAYPAAALMNYLNKVDIQLPLLKFPERNYNQ